METDDTWVLPCSIYRDIYKQDRIQFILVYWKYYRLKLNETHFLHCENL